MKKSQLTKAMTACFLTALVVPVMNSAYAVTAEEKKTLAWYGDFDGHRMASINLENMTVRNVTPDTDAGPYGMEAGKDDDHIWVLTRKSDYLDELESNLDVITQRIYLGYQPREVNTNSAKTYAVVSGRDIPAHSVIEIGKNGAPNRVVQEFNTDLTPVTLTGFGGQNATGHPVFITDDIYVILDRVNKRLSAYSIELGSLVASVDTPSSPHHMIRQGSDLFFSLEGNEESRPGILQVEITEDIDQPLGGVRYMPLEPVKPTGSEVNIEDMGVHHINFHTDGRHIYAGSAEGNMYVVDSVLGTVVDNFPIGKGAGHTDFAPTNQLVVVTPHKDSFITIMDCSDPTDNKLVEHVQVALQAEAGTVMQGHTQAISEDERHFYGAATHDGVFFEIDLLGFAHDGEHPPVLSREIYLDGANLEQGLMFISPEGFYGNNPIGQEDAQTPEG